MKSFSILCKIYIKTVKYKSFLVVFKLVWKIKPEDEVTRWNYIYLNENKSYFGLILKIFDNRTWKSNKNNLVWCFSKIKTVFLEHLSSDFLTKRFLDLESCLVR